MDNRRRTIAKTILWRIIAVTVTMMVSFIWLREWDTSITLVITANAIKAVLYYMHERVWNGISFGRIEKVDEDYSI